MTKLADTYKTKNNIERELLDIINKESPHYRYKSLVDIDCYKQTPIMKFFEGGVGHKLSKRQWDYLLKNSDLTQKNYAGENVLCYAITIDKHKILSDEQWEYLLEKTSLTEQDEAGWDTLCYTMFAKDSKIKKEIIKKILDENINYFNGDYWDKIISKDNIISAQIPETKKLVEELAEEIKERIKTKKVIDKAVNKKKKKSLIKI